MLYEDSWTAAIVLSWSLLSTAAVLTGLWISVVKLNITAPMGMTMIIGMGAEMAIFYVSEATALALLRLV